MPEVQQSVQCRGRQRRVHVELDHAAQLLQSKVMGGVRGAHRR